MKTIILSLLAVICVSRAYSFVNIDMTEHKCVEKRDSILNTITGASISKNTISITDFGAKGDGLKIVSLLLTRL